MMAVSRIWNQKISDISLTAESRMRLTDTVDMPLSHTHKK